MEKERLDTCASPGLMQGPAKKSTEDSETRRTYLLITPPVAHVFSVNLKKKKVLGSYYEIRKTNAIVAGMVIQNSKIHLLNNKFY